MPLSAVGAELPPVDTQDTVQAWWELEHKATHIERTQADGGLRF